MVAFQLEVRDGQPGLDDRSHHRRALTVALAAVVVLVVVGAAVAMGALLARTPTTPSGVQVDAGGTMVLRNATVAQWHPMPPLGNAARDGFPEPMVSRTDGVCIGFGRLDYDPDRRRPSLARCEQLTVEPAMRDNEIRALVAVRSGFDTWHFVEAADDVLAVNVMLADGRELTRDRVHLADSTVGLRLENGVAVSSLQWSTASGTYGCETDSQAWESSVFCRTELD